MLDRLAQRRIRKANQWRASQEALWAAQKAERDYELERLETYRQRFLEAYARKGSYADNALQALIEQNKRCNGEIPEIILQRWREMIENEKPAKPNNTENQGFWRFILAALATFFGGTILMAMTNA